MLPTLMWWRTRAWIELDGGDLSQLDHHAVWFYLCGSWLTNPTGDTPFSLKPALASRKGTFRGTSAGLSVQPLVKMPPLKTMLTTMTVTQISPTAISQPMRPVAIIVEDPPTIAISGIISASETMARAKR